MKSPNKRLDSEKNDQIKQRTQRFDQNELRSDPWSTDPMIRFGRNITEDKNRQSITYYLPIHYLVVSRASDKDWVSLN